MNLSSPTVLTIAGSDSYGGAGIQIDSKVIHSLGGYAFTAITALTAQNSQGVQQVFHTPIDSFKAQLHAILEDVEVDAVKIGMLSNAEIVQAVIEVIDHYALKNIVLDTVLLSSSGHRLLEESAVELMKTELFPRVDLITPNIPEVEMLCGFDFDIDEDQEKAFACFREMGAKAVLFKGGHSEIEDPEDHLYTVEGISESFDALWVETTHTHGTGCFYSSAVATHLAKKIPLDEAVALSKRFLTDMLEEASFRLKFKYRDRKVDRKEPIL